MTCRHLVVATRTLAALLLTVALPVARAATFSVSPIRVELDARHRAAILTVNNSGDAPLRMQVRPMLWIMQADGQWKLTPSDDLIVTPELLEVSPGKSLQMRVGSLVDAGASETSYRLLIDELPNLGDGKSAARPEIKVLTQVSLPVFDEPAVPRRMPLLRSASLRKDVLELGIGNDGSQRLDAQSVKVSLYDSAGHVLGDHDEVENYVLAGSTWFLRLKLPATSCPQATSVSMSWSSLAITSPSHPITRGAEACEGSSSP
ncbi:MAG: fimbria/pilus periplasmic chaperone [Rhodanobacter sp.]